MKNEKIRRIDTIGGGVVVNASASGGGSGAAHVPVTLGAGSDPATTLIGQQLTVPAYGAQMAAHALLATGVHGAGASTLATVANIATHTAIAGAHHAAVTLGSHTDHFLTMSAGQVLDSVVVDANKALMGPTSGAAANADWRALVSADIPDEAITYAKMQHVSAADKVLGRSSAGAGDVQEIACTSFGRALLDDASVAAQCTTLGLGTADGPTFDHLHITADVAAATLTLGADAGLLRSGANILGIASGDSVQSTTYTPGLAGWNISAAGNAEFANVRVRGAIQASVFEKSVVSAFAGSLIVAKSAGKISVAFVVDNTAVAFANTANLFITTGPDGGWAFATNDIRIKAEYSGGVGDTWGTVTRTATLNEYTITINYGTINVTWPAGTAVVDYGVSGGGFFGVSADGTYGATAAWVLATHDGDPWTHFTAQVYAGTDGKLYAGAGAVVLDATGITAPLGTIGGWTLSATEIKNSGATAILKNTGYLAFGVAGDANADHSKIPVSSTKGTGIFLDSTGLYGLYHADAAAGRQFYLDATTGAAMAGAGNVTLDATGIAVTAGSAGVGSNNAYRLLVGGVTIGQLGAYSTGSSQWLIMDVNSVAGTASKIDIRSFAPADKRSTISLTAYSDVTSIQLVGGVQQNTSFAQWNMYGKLYTDSSIFCGTTSGGLHVGGTSDPGDNNLLVDGTTTVTGAFGCNTKAAQTAYATGAWDAPGAGAYGADSAAHFAALVLLVQKLQAALVANGICS
jgi:hypothetical protein